MLQNVSDGDAEIAESVRKKVLLEIRRVLVPGGKLVLTTRAVPEVGRYSDLYWYADPNFAPKGVATMEKLVPNKPENELRLCDFQNIKKVYSIDKVIKTESYFNPNLVATKAFQSADSFFSRVPESEMLALVDHLEKMNDDEKDAYMKERDKLRNGQGHVVIMYAEKRESE